MISEFCCLASVNTPAAAMQVYADCVTHFFSPIAIPLAITNRLQRSEKVHGQPPRDAQKNRAFRLKSSRRRLNPCLPRPAKPVPHSREADDKTQALCPVRRQETYGTRLADKSFVAKKFQTSGTMVRNAADFAAMNLRMATMHLSGMRIPPRVRTVPSLRLRLSVAIISEPPQSVIIRQVAPNLDSPVTETRPSQSQRV